MTDNNKYEKYVQLLKANKNLILTGAPGTGKTYLAKAIAEAMGAEYDFVQFHPSYDYTDFIEGLRPTLPDKNGNIGFERKNGVFKDFCKKALTQLSDNQTQSPKSNQNPVRSAASFDEAYKKLIDLIRNNNIVLYSDFRKKKPIKLKIEHNSSEKNSLDTIYYFYRDYRKKADITHLRKIYNYYLSKGQFNIQSERTNTICDIIGHITTYYSNSFRRTIQYYRGIVQGLLDLTFRQKETHTSSDSNDLFEQHYNELLEDIKSNRVEDIPLRNGTSTKLSVTSGNCIKWQRRSDEENDASNVVSLSRLLKLYSEYPSLEDVESMTNINETIRSVIGGANTTYYWAVLHEILCRIESHRSEQIGDIEKSEDSSRVKTDPIPYVFIIDEINRGEISKIFGELFFSIDPGYRGKKGTVKTQYQNLITDPTDPFFGGFYIPENVYIIGTMNDIDRSVESMDFAMRRRFAWKEVKADENTEMLNELTDLTDEVLGVMKRLNSAIWDESNNRGIEGLNSAYHIGGAYFSKLLLYLNSDKSNKEEAYKYLWENHLKGVLFEYLRGSLNALENLRTLERVYFNHIKDDITEG